MTPTDDNAALGLSFGVCGVVGASTTPSSPERSMAQRETVAGLAPIVTSAKSELHSGDGHKSGAGVLAHPAIPPPPSPRRHRSGGLSRMRAASGGIVPSKSFGDLIHGLAMTSAPQAMDSPMTETPTSSTLRSASDGARLGEEPTDAEETGDYDNR